MKKESKKCELLIPVGNAETLELAIHNGADAVYLGGKKFGARAYSNNFNDEEMIMAIKKCHLYGVKIYVTVNTMIYNDEIEEVMAYLKFLYEQNVDAVIMQDLGLITRVRQELPNLEIHVSTQAHNHNEEGIKYFKELGCTRVVFDRESSLEDIASIDVPIEKEVFIYGALCISYSGNCLFSALNGGRSANRGMCVGSCRLPYTLYKDGRLTNEGYLLSTKDLNTLPRLKEILDQGIDSLKVEGRMKSKEYVGIVTKTIRMLLDKYYNHEEMVINDEDYEKLLKTYNRGFTLGYLFKEDNIINSETSNHQGIKIGQVIDVNDKRIKIKLDKELHQEDAIRFKMTNTGMFVNTLYNKRGLLVAQALPREIVEVDNKDHLAKKDLLGSEVLKTIDYLLNKEINDYVKKKIPVSLQLRACLNEPLYLNISDGNNTLEITGSIVERAKTSAISQDRIKAQLVKMGNTPFMATDVDITMDDNIFVSIKVLNELRRTLTDKLMEVRANKKKEDLERPLIREQDEIQSKKIEPMKLAILVRQEEQLKLAILNKVDIIYVTDETLYQKYHHEENVYYRLERVLTKYQEYRNERLLCTELGSVVKYGENNQIRSDYYLNVANDETVKTLQKLNCLSTAMSIEATTEQIMKMQNKNQLEVIVYGLAECMVIKNNIFKIEGEQTILKDSKKQSYQVKYENGLTHIFNAHKIDEIDKVKEYKKMGIGVIRLELSDENGKETQNIINKVRSMIQ